MTVLEMFDRSIPDVPGVPDDFMELLRAGMSNDPTLRPAAATLRDQLTRLPLAASAATPGLPETVSAPPVTGLAPAWAIAEETMPRDLFEDEEPTRMHQAVRPDPRPPATDPIPPADVSDEPVLASSGGPGSQTTGKRHWWRSR
jgi:hypothetical protein